MGKYVHIEDYGVNRPIQCLPQDAVRIATSRSFLRRLWYLVSNPFLYLFKGKLRY